LGVDKDYNWKCDKVVVAHLKYNLTATWHDIPMTFRSPVEGEILMRLFRFLVKIINNARHKYNKNKYITGNIKKRS